MADASSLEENAKRLGIGSYRRHVLLCTGPKCCSNEDGMKAWETLKGALAAADAAGEKLDCYRTKVGCLRVCEAGPVCVVYPEGTWYRDMTADRIDRLVNEHLKLGQPIAEWTFAENRMEGK